MHQNKFILKSLQISLIIFVVNLCLKYAMKPLFLFFFLGLFVFGCKSDSKSETSTDKTNTQEDYHITSKDIENLKYTDFVLSSDSKNAVSTWQKYTELSAQITLLRTGDLSFFKNEKQLMITFITDFKKEIPQTIKTEAIYSRIAVLETSLLKLQNLANLDNIKRNNLLKSIKALLVAYANLNLQINKKFELESQIIEQPY